MKIKFVKNAFGYKADQEIEVTADEAKAFGDAVVEVKAVEVGDVAAKAAGDLLSAVDAKIEAVEKKIAKAFADRKPSVITVSDRVDADPQAGFKSFGEFARDVVAFSKGFDTSDNFKRYIKSTTGNTSGNAPDAGPTVPVQYTSEIFRVAGNLPNFWDLAYKIPVTTNAVKIPVFKNYGRSNTTAANGIVANITSEAAAITQSRSNWEQLSLSLGKEAVLVPVSNELLEDNVVSLDAVIARESAYQITKALNRGIIQGSSILSGIIGHAATKDVATATTAASGTGVSFVDVMDMYAAFAHDDADYNSAVWFVHPTVLPKLAAMTSGNYNVYTAPGAANDAPSGRLLGRPIIVTGQCNAVGTSGDIILADMSKYVGIYKGGLNAAASMHLFFNTDEQAFRFTLRVGGKPGLSGVITLEDGSTTVSPFVTLATRV